ncbi:MAG: S-formylglutathione hydrolase [Rhodospirillaceae bacterium TMED8]|nr:S-formylglutathione hydrolase [Magnetovibrio sp.]OUT48908.1 MAG: S-formylglutathione hydrolase [Rhodospirillaceae bacterium TMED8]
MPFTTVSEQKIYGGTQGVYRHTSRETSCEMELSVFMPLKDTNDRVPVVYYLSGLTCTQENVTTKSGFQRFAAQHKIAVVCPDTSPRGAGYSGEDDSYDFGSGAGFYVDATVAPWSGMYRMYSYVTSELPILIASHFPIDNERAGIFGHSMGGHGALTIALKNPSHYKTVSAFAPIVAPMQCPWGKKALTGYLGPDQQTWIHYDATELVNLGKKVHGKILIDQGSADTFLKEQLKPDLFVEACRASGQPVELRIHDGYDHSYYLMATFMEDHIRHHALALNF